jgi:hypothetical protein
MALKYRPASIVPQLAAAKTARASVYTIASELNYFSALFDETSVGAAPIHTP